MVNTVMRIGILGTGDMAAGLGSGWRAAGYEVLAGGRSGPVALDAAGRFGDVVLLAVPAAAAVEVLAHVPPARIVIDCTNDVTPGFGVGHPYAEIVAARPDLAVVKGFNLCHESVWRLPSRVFGGRALAVPLCGPPDAVEAVRPLVTALGCTPVDAGGPERAALLEATAAFAIGLWFAGVDAQAVLQPLHVDGATTVPAGR
ncbi:NAD(P)-binding domain-containing protein [Actinophytocola sp.]|uniref:NAD(P)-binding domain-containing protein n=1 Tax=Actinophytocola sp. TaxID=1872138 RepID=UPI00389A666B